MSGVTAARAGSVNAAAARNWWASSTRITPWMRTILKTLPSNSCICSKYYTNVNSRQWKMKEMSEVLAFEQSIAAMDRLPAEPKLAEPVAPALLAQGYLCYRWNIYLLSMCYLCHLWNIYAICGISMLSINILINPLLTNRCAIYGISMLSMVYLCYR